MRTRQFIKILKDASATSPESARVTLFYLIETLEDEEKINKIVIFGCSLIIFGLVLGWFAFGYLASLR